MIELTTRPGSGDPEAFSMSTGQRLWTTALDGSAGAMDLSAGRLAVSHKALHIFELWRSKSGYVISVKDGEDRPPRHGSRVTLHR